MEDNLSFRCEFEEICLGLFPMLDLMSKLKNKKSEVLDYTDLRKGYEVVLKKLCNDKKLCKECSLYKLFSEQKKRREEQNPSPTYNTSADGEEFDANGWRK